MWKLTRASTQFLVPKVLLLHCCPCRVLFLKYKPIWLWLTPCMSPFRGVSGELEVEIKGDCCLETQKLFLSSVKL